MRLSTLRVLAPALLLIALLPLGPAATAAPRISVATFEPGTVYWQRFGHDALIVRDRGEQTAYNYGIFDFNQKNFFLNFVRGRMQYRLAAQPLAQAVYPYYVENRAAVEQRLALSPAQASELAAYLAHDALPENAQYRYDYFRNNCATRLRDAIDRVMDGRLRAQLSARPARLSYREQVLRVSAPQPWLMLGMDIGLGPAADVPINLWQEAFIPGVLARALRHVERADGRPLVSGERPLLSGAFDTAPQAPPTLLPWFALAGLGLAALLLMLAYWRRNRAARLALAAVAGVFTLLCAVGGWFLLGVWGLTEHWATYANRNLLLLNPLCLMLLPLWFCAARRNWRPGRASLGAAGLVALAALAAAVGWTTPLWGQDNLRWIVFFLPVHLALFAIAWRAARGAHNAVP